MSHNSNGYQRYIKVLLMLPDPGSRGITPGQIATALNADPATIGRDLRNLLVSGVAEKITLGEKRQIRWRKTSAFVWEVSPSMFH
ncbi:MAG: hypothetical protein GY862_33215, partial [Gammaproteobacteria bacterium]|nr:hypothetical protein [Gammaproteobacteria bacterium]